MAVIGEELEGYVINQINARQTLHGSGVGHTGTLRTDKQINLLNSNTSWIKLASGVSVSEARLKDINIDNSDLKDMGLAKNNILFSGISKLKTQTVEGKSYTQLEQREGFLPRDDNSSYTYGSFGFSPMPGIHSADIKTLTRGSLKKATVKLTANNKQQFDIIDLLYMRLGYTVLLEWGNSIYTTTGFDKEILRNTLIEEKFFESAGSDSYFTFLEDIENKRDKYEGNYDALLGKVSNFNWSFNTDGSYDIELTIISLGDVIESLKSNLSVDKKTNDFLNTFKTSTSEVTTIDPPDPTVDEENTSADIITAMLAIYKFVNRTQETGTNVQIIGADGTQHDVGLLLDNDDSGDGQYVASSSTDYVLSKTFKIKVYSNANGLSSISYNGTGRYKVTQKFSSNNDEIGKDEAVKIKNEFQKATKELTINQLIKGDSVGKLEIIELEKLTVIQATKTGGVFTYVDVSDRTETFANNEDLTKKTNSPLKIERNSDTKTIPNPLVNFGWNDAFKLKIKDAPPHYIRFGALLEYIKDNIIIKINNTKKDPLFDIDISEWDTYMYSLPNQISLDPRICIVRNNNIEVGQTNKTQAFTKLQYFKVVDAGISNDNAAFTLNIYLNFDFVLECLKADEKGNVSVYELISNICTGLNRALGGINNLEPIIDETDNTLRIIDTTPIPGHSAADNGPGYKLQIYGYDKVVNDYISNFVRKVDLKTAITPEYATMITVGSTAGGYIKGTEATAFSKWNTGLTDRFKEELLPPDGIKNITDKNEAALNYVDIFHYPKGRANRFGINDFGPGMKFSDNIIEKNLSIVTEFYKWLIAYSSPDDKLSGGTVGFIPFKLGLTLDGISGIKIYNVLRINTEFLPKAYGKTVDLIVTGVSHRLDNNDWETSIEATVMPKTGEMALVTITAEQAVTSINNATTITSCKSLPPAKGLSSSVKGLIKASTTKDSIIVQAIVDNLEGGYYHPTHAFSFSQTDRNTYKNSGETLYGLDRYAGNNEGIRKGPKNQSGIDFWAAVDAISGNGSYKDTSRTVKTGQWNIKKYPKKSGIWSWNHMPKKSESGYDNLQKNLTKYITNSYNSLFNKYLAGHPVGQLVQNDGRLKFMYYRATWNGSGFFQKYASNLKAIYDKGEKNIDNLICADLTFRYNTKAPAFKPGVSKISFMMDYKKP